MRSYKRFDARQAGALHREAAPAREGLAAVAGTFFALLQLVTVTAIELRASLATTVASVAAALVRQGYVSAVVIATQAMLSLGLTSFSRDVVISLAQQGYLAEAGKVCTVAVRRGATATVQQLSWLLLTAPPPQPESSVFAMVEVPVAFWTAANAEGWAAWDVAVVMAAPMVRAIDAGYAPRLAYVQRALFSRQLLHLLMWILKGVVEWEGRPDAAAVVAWEAIEQGGAEVLIEVSALSVAEGHLVMAAAVVQALYRLERGKATTEVVTNEDPDFAVEGQDRQHKASVLTQVAGKAILMGVHRGHAENVVLLTEILLENGYTDFLNDVTTHLVVSGYSEEMGEVSAAALAAGKPGVVAHLSAVLANPHEGSDGTQPGVLAAVAGETLKLGAKKLGEAFHSVMEE